MTNEDIVIKRRDLEWMAQTIHNAYHDPKGDELSAESWRTCRKTVCDWVRATLMAGGI